MNHETGEQCWRFLGAQDPEHEVVIITAFCTAASPPGIRPHSDASFGVWVHPPLLSRSVGRSHLVRVRLNRSKPQQWRRRGCAPSFEKGPEALSSVEAKPSSSCQN
uniref:Uncharacterized protein n=1 Tax=Oryza glumipatula TaxID=40148 RepID=A0A0E0BKN5_9ORYZ